MKFFFFFLLFPVFAFGQSTKKFSRQVAMNDGALNENPKNLEDRLGATDQIYDFKNDFTIAYSVKSQNNDTKKLFFKQESISKDNFLELAIANQKFYLQAMDSVVCEFQAERIFNKSKNLVLLRYEAPKLTLIVNDNLLYSDSVNIQQALISDWYHADAINQFIDRNDRIMLFNFALEQKEAKKVFDSFSNTYAVKTMRKVRILGQDTLLFEKNVDSFSQKDTAHLHGYIDVKTHSPYLRFDIWDYQQNDFDSLSIFDDKDEVICSRLNIRKKKTSFSYKLDPDKNNYIFFHALNTGEKGGNTCRFRFWEINPQYETSGFFRRAAIKLSGNYKEKTSVYSQNVASFQNKGVKIYYEPNLQKGGDEYKILQRTPVVQKKIKSTAREVRLQIWDNKMVDNDIISMSFNNHFYLNHFRLNKNKKEVSIKLIPNTINELAVYAINKGRRGENTAQVNIYLDGKFYRSLSLESTKKSNAIVLFDTRL